MRKDGLPTTHRFWAGGVPAGRVRAGRLAGVKACALAGAVLLAASPAAGDIDVSPGGLEHYAHCMSQAKDSNEIYGLDRTILYRCHGVVAISYFNFLGRRHVRDRMASEPNGLYVYRDIDGVGKCWNKVANAWGAPESTYGCDLFVDL